MNVCEQFRTTYARWVGKTWMIKEENGDTPDTHRFKSLRNAIEVAFKKVDTTLPEYPLAECEVCGAVIFAKDENIMGKVIDQRPSGPPIGHYIPQEDYIKIQYACKVHMPDKKGCPEEEPCQI